MGALRHPTTGQPPSGPVTGQPQSSSAPCPPEFTDWACRVLRLRWVDVASREATGMVDAATSRHDTGPAPPISEDADDP